MATAVSDNRLARRMKLVEEHVGYENSHDLAGVLGTFGDAAHYDDEPWALHYEGRDGVQDFYSQLMAAVPDLGIDIRQWHVTQESIVLEVVISGTHLGMWRGLPATGRRVEFPLCGVYTFDENDRLAGEKIYYDRATVLRQLGMFHEPQGVWGQLVNAASHPVTVANVLRRKVGRKGAIAAALAGLGIAAAVIAKRR